MLIDGPNVYLREADQTVVKVATNAGTTISVTSTGTVANLHPGDTVRVTGPTGSDGTIAATSLTAAGRHALGADSTSVAPEVPVRPVRPSRRREAAQVPVGRPLPAAPVGPPY